jgi:hypothetical protein
MHQQPVVLPDFRTQLLLPVSEGMQDATINVPTEKCQDFCLTTANSIFSVSYVWALGKTKFC